MPSIDILRYSSVLSVLFLPLIEKILQTVLNNWVILSFDIWENARLTLGHEWKKSLCCSLHIFPASGILRNICKESLFQHFRDRLAFLFRADN